MVVDKINPNAKIVCEEERIRPDKSEVDRLLGSNEKLRRLTNWTQQYTFEEGLDFTIEWLRENVNRYKPEIYNL